MNPTNAKENIPQESPNEIEGDFPEEGLDDKNRNTQNNLVSQTNALENVSQTQQKINKPNVDSNLNPYQNNPSAQGSLASKFANLNLGEPSKSKPNKNLNKNTGLAFNYFFGENPSSEKDIKVGFNQQSNSMYPQSNYYQHEHEQNEDSHNTDNFDANPENKFKSDLRGEDNFQLGNDNFIGGKNFNRTQTFQNSQEKSNLPQNFNPLQQQQIPQSFQMENNEEVDNQLYKLNYAKSANIPGKFYVIKSIDDSNIMRVSI